MKKLYFIMISMALIGCSSKKEIVIVDSKGIPVKNCLLFAVQANMLWYNQQGFFKSDNNGKLIVPYSNLVNVYAGKKGYAISRVSIVNSGTTKIPLLELGEITDKLYAKSNFRLYDVPPKKLSIEEQEWIDYSQNVPMININK